MKEKMSHIGAQVKLRRASRSVELLETLEPRRLMHGDASIGLLEGLPVDPRTDHVLIKTFAKAYPQYAADPWNPQVFNPQNSTKPSDWLYDAHDILDTRSLKKRGQKSPGALLPRGKKNVTARGTRSAKIVAAASATGTGSSASHATPLAAASVSEVLPDFIPAMNGTPYTDLTTQSGRTLLRFGTEVRNAGTGPAILVGGPVNSDGTQTVYQRVYNYDSNSRAFSAGRDRIAGNFTYHANHGHIHFDGYARYTLRNRNADGSVGSIVTRPDGQLAAGQKVGFCLININSSFTLPNGQSSTTLPGYGGNGQPATSCGQLQGIHVGYADVYTASLDGQFVDVTGVANGNYFVEITLDALNGVQESDESNNTVFVPFTYGTVAATNDRFEPNNSASAATPLGTIGTSVQAGLSINTGTDQDWFSFTAASSGSATILMQAASGDIDLALYNSAGTSQLAISQSSGSTESITYNFVQGTTYLIKVYGYSGASTNNYSLTATVPPRISVTATTAATTEGGSALMYRVSRVGSMNQALTVNLNFSGTATFATDYLASSTAVIPVDVSFVDFSVQPLNDTLVEGNETVVVSIASNAAYRVDSAAPSATGSITDVVVPTAPIAPTSLLAIAAGAAQINLTWTDNATNESGYKIERRIGTGAWGLIATTAANATSYANTLLSSNTTFEYRVRATNSVGDSANSNTAQATTAATATATTSSVASSINPANVGQPVIFTATVSSAVGIPTGNVNFLDGTTLLGSVALDATGKATYSSSALIAGSHNITAVFAGSTSYLSSTSAILTQTVNTVTVLPIVNFATGFSGATSIQLNGASAINGSDLQLTTTGNTYKAASAFTSSAINLSKFNTSFDFQLSAGAATGHGFTFTIQNQAATAIGQSGSGLGYGNDYEAGTAVVGKSVAIKFDLFSNEGEGANSTGLFTNGANPTINASNQDLTSSGIDFHSGNRFNVKMNYVGTTLTVTIKDTVTNASTTKNYTIDIASTIGGSTAYVGFTAATGGRTSTQRILNWTLSNV